ncbi:MAG: coproporphyrinogen III oxidase family protein, partial [Calditrichaeota bacterium]
MTAGLYIHIPFCEKRCGYCDFYTLAHRQSTIPEYIQALKKEIRMYARYPEIQALEFDTIYFGGGTPSLLTVKQIREILDSAYTYLKISCHPEITLEVNPGTVDRTKLRGYRTLGVNRLSLGIQSFQPQELQFLDRIHSAEEAIDCFYNARAADFTNLGIDLIFAIPGQKLQTWEKNLNQAISLEPEHISAYN